ncbi:lamina-associated polypeptide 2-like [Hyperolius riggenbachi]|uniref:lamina-associated polypeptide 2-like n=1 Tax=Hyperolius riggenbachi TaxID=752182 RepID=UPI0035A34FE0
MQQPTEPSPETKQTPPAGTEESGQQPKPVKSSGKSNKCTKCGGRLPEGTSKSLCTDCYNKSKSHSPRPESTTVALLDLMKSMKQELATTFSAFRAALPPCPVQMVPLPQVPAALPASSTAQPVVITSQLQVPQTGSVPIDQSVSLPVLPSTQRVDTEVPQNVGIENPSPFSDVSEASDEGELAESDASGNTSATVPRYLFNAEDTSELLKAVYDSEQIEQPRPSSTPQDDIYRGLEDRGGRVFPVHRAVRSIISAQWKDPEGRLFIPRSFKRRFPFNMEEHESLFKCPRLDAPLSQCSKDTDLSFEDMGTLKDPMDRKAEALLKRAWDSTSFSFKPAISSVCVARNLDKWVRGLQERLEEGTPHARILESLPVIIKSIAFLADAATESLRAAAKTAALINSARRAVWLNTWQGDVTSKQKLCGMAFQGDLLFGRDLDSVLERSSNRARKFPDKNKSGKRSFQSRKPFLRQDQPNRGQRQNKKWTYNAGRGRPFLFNKPQPAPSTAKSAK